MRASRSLSGPPARRLSREERIFGKKRPTLKTDSTLRESARGYSLSSLGRTSRTLHATWATTTPFCSQNRVQKLPTISADDRAMVWTPILMQNLSTSSSCCLPKGRLLSVAVAPVRRFEIGGSGRCKREGEAVIDKWAGAQA